MTLNGPLIAAVSFAYLGLLFALAYWADRRADQVRSVIDRPTVYALSLAVYCTAWTFYPKKGSCLLPWMRQANEIMAKGGAYEPADLSPSG